MTKNALACVPARHRGVRAYALTAALLCAVALHACAEVAPRDSVLAIQRQVESIQPGLIKSTVVIRLPDGSGSGVIVSPDGLILTAGHVVEGREGRNVWVVLSDGRSFRSTVIASDQNTDLGIVKMQGIEGLTPARIGDSSTLHTGQWILAAGHPLGLHVDRPPVLRIGRVLRVGWRTGRGNITTDAPIISGDSGGPLFDLNGRVVGINSMITTGTPRMESIHVPVNLAKAAVARSLRGETPDTWDGPPAPFAADVREAQADLESGNVTAALRLAREAAGIDPASATAELLVARADARSGQSQQALTALAEACDRGYDDADKLRQDPDLGPLLRQAGASKLLSRIEAFNALPGRRKVDVTAAALVSLANVDHGVVRIQSGNSDVTLGTVMSADGDVLTKASELPEGALTCVLPDGKVVPVERRGVNTAWDVALLKVAASGLKTLPLTDGVTVGEWAFSPDNTGKLQSIGIVGVAEMPVKGRGIAPKPTSKAFMGVRLQPVDAAILKAAGVPQGVAVQVEPDLPAARAGVRNGDIIFDVEGSAISDPDTFMDLMVKKKPGDPVTMKLARGSERITVTIPLAARPAGLPGRNGLPEMLSGDISRMQGPFDQVIHHDSVLKPNAMGGPLLDSEGHCIGLNIARADRTSTYAIAAHNVRAIYDRLKASR